MNPLHRILPAARSRIERVSRRDVLAGGVAAGTYVAMRGVEELAVRALVDPLLSDPGLVPHMRMDLDVADFERLASAGQRALLDGLRVSGSIPDAAAGRCTVMAERDGDLWVEHQGEEASRILWGRPAMAGRMADQPDRTFGRWRAECIRMAARKRAPTFELVRAVVNGKPHRYTALVISRGDRIYSVTAPEPAMPHSAPRSTTPMIDRVSA